MVRDLLYLVRFSIVLLSYSCFVFSTGIMQYTLYNNDNLIASSNSSVDECYSNLKFSPTAVITNLELSLKCVSSRCTADNTVYLCQFSPASKDRSSSSSSDDSEGGSVAGIVVAIFVFSIILAICLFVRRSRTNYDPYYGNTGVIIQPPPQQYPYAETQYGAQPYGAQPYGAQPYGAQPYGAQPYSAQPYAGQQQQQPYVGQQAPTGGTFAVPR
jgi:hypothetical protein